MGFMMIWCQDNAGVGWVGVVISLKRGQKKTKHCCELSSGKLGLHSISPFGRVSTLPILCLMGRAFTINTL